MEHKMYIPTKMRHRATFYRYRQGFVYGVAQKLGWY